MQSTVDRNRVSITGVPMNLWNVTTSSIVAPNSEDEALAIIELEGGVYEGSLWGALKTWDKWKEGLNDFERLTPVKWDAALKDFVEA